MYFPNTREEFLDLIERAVRPIIAEEISKLRTKEDEDELLTTDQAASFLHVTNATLLNWRKQSKIKCFHLGGRVYYSKQLLLNLFNNSLKAKK